MPCSNVMPVPTTSAMKLVSSLSTSITSSIIPANSWCVKSKRLCVLEGLPIVSMIDRCY